MKYSELFHVKPGSEVRLNKINPDYTATDSNSFLAKFGGNSFSRVTELTLLPLPAKIFDPLPVLGGKLLHSLQRFQVFVDNSLWQRDVTKFLGELLPVSETPVDKLLYVLSYLGVVRFLVKQQPRESGDRVTIFPIRIRRPRSK